MSTYELPANLAISESGFIFAQSTGETFTLNYIGKEILDMLKQGHGRDEIIKVITEEYDVDKTSFEKDFIDFINQLKQYQLLKEI